MCERPNSWGVWHNCEVSRHQKMATAAAIRSGALVIPPDAEGAPRAAELPFVDATPFVYSLGMAVDWATRFCSWQNADAAAFRRMYPATAWIPPIASQGNIGV